MRDYSSEFKLKVAKDNLNLGGKVRVATFYGIYPADVHNRVLTYRTHGLPSLQKRALQQHTPEFKFSVFRYVKTNQISMRSTAALLNIAALSSIATSQRLFNEDGFTALEPKPKLIPILITKSRLMLSSMPIMVAMVIGGCI
jgi:transposase-like protein